MITRRGYSDDYEEGILMITSGGDSDDYEGRYSNDYEWRGL